MAVKNENYIEMSDVSFVPKKDQSASNSAITIPTEQDNLIDTSEEINRKDKKAQKECSVYVKEQHNNKMPPKPGWKGKFQMKRFLRCFV